MDVKLPQSQETLKRGEPVLGATLGGGGGGGGVRAYHVSGDKRSQARKTSSQRHLSVIDYMYRSGVEIHSR